MLTQCIISSSTTAPVGQENGDKLQNICLSSLWEAFRNTRHLWAHLQSFSLTKSKQAILRRTVLPCQIFCKGFWTEVKMGGAKKRWPSKDKSLLMCKGASNWVSIHPFIVCPKQTKLPLSFHFLRSAKVWAKYFAKVFAVSKKRAVKLCTPTAAETS